MGYCVDFEDAHFFMKAEDRKKAKDAIKAAFPNGAAWVTKAEVARAKSFRAIMREFGRFESRAREEGHELGGRGVAGNVCR